MKRLLILLLFSCSSVLFAQVITTLSQFEITEEDNHVYVEYGIPLSNYPSNFSISKDDFDTLYLSLDSIDYMQMNIVFVGPNYVYKQSNIIWLTNNFGYIALNSEHQFDIGIRWWTETEIFWVIHENYSVYQTDTIELKVEDAIYELEFSSVDINNIPFDQLEGSVRNKIYVMFPQGNGYYMWRFFDIPGDTTYFSEVSEDILIQCSSIFYDVETEFYACFIEFPTLYGINSSKILINDPGNYIHTSAEMFITEETVSQTSIGFTTGIFYPIYTGNFYFYGSGVLPYVNPIAHWHEDLYLIQQDNESVRLHASMMALTSKEGLTYSKCWEPFLDNINDSITGYWSMFPPNNQYLSGDSDTLHFGNSPSTLWYNWYNNGPENKIAAYGGSYGMLGEYIKSQPDLANYKIKDENGNSIWAGSGCEVIEYYNLDPGYYSVEVINSSCPISNGYGKSILNASFNYGSDDANPPKLNPIQFRNSQNQPTYEIESGGKLTLLFSAVDLHGIYDSVGYPVLIYQPVIDDSTKVYIKDSSTNEWEEIDIEKYDEDTIAGYFYMSDLSEYTNLDSSALDLRINIQDYNGNTAEYIISPAVLIDGFLITGIETDFINNNELDYTVYPNPVNDWINFSNNNFDKKDCFEIQFQNLSGQLIKNIVNVKPPHYKINVADLKPGVYLYAIKEKGVVVQQGKLIKR